MLKAQEELNHVLWEDLTGNYLYNLLLNKYELCFE